MLWMLVAVCSAVAVYLIALSCVVPSLAAVPRAWRVLAWSGLPLSLSGFGFATRFWNPSAGPYVANRLYPFGGQLQAWAVSFGFTWAAFGLLFTGAVVLASQRRSWQSWSLLLASWLLCVWPHAIIGIAFTVNGANQESARIYGRWWASSAVCPKGSAERRRADSVALHICHRRLHCDGPGPLESKDSSA